jgi:hypothetical protein
MEVPLSGAADDVNARADERVWRSQIAVRAEPRHVLETLTCVDACEMWSPVGFELDDQDLPRLRTGTRVGVSGGVAGHRVRFCVEILRADVRRLSLRAAGPVELFADYEVEPVVDGSRVDAAVVVRPRPGRLAGVLARITAGLLAGGALPKTLTRIAREAERRQVTASASSPSGTSLTPIG